MLKQLIAATVVACGALSACAGNPPQYDLRKSTGPCMVGFETEGDTTYVVLDRKPEGPGYVSGAFWAVISFFITNKEGNIPVTLTAKPTDLRVPIPSSSPIIGHAPGSCSALDSPPVLLSRGKS